jgi:archaemetzincin
VEVLVRVRILSHSELDKKVYQRLEAGLAEVFPRIRITLDDREHSPPPSCFDRSRGQYNSTLILQFLRSSVERGENERMLAVESVDLYAGHLNFVFGEADPDIGIAVVSTHRLRPEFYGEASNPELLLSRLVKEAVHELGHTFRLGHCPDQTCVMHFSNSILDTDLKAPHFCPRCRFRLGLRDRYI